MTTRLGAVARGVWVAQSSLYATNSVVVVAGTDALVVDPGVSAAEISGLAREVHSRGWRVRAGFSTHPHWDHVLWMPELGDGPRWAHPAAVAHARSARDHLLAEARDALGPDGVPGPDLFADLTPLPPAGGPLDWLPAEVMAHEAHAPGHAGLLLPEPRVLLAGDMLSDREVPLLDLESPDPLAAYHAALDLLEGALDRGVRTLVPGHGSPTDAGGARARLALDRTYVAALRDGRGVDDDPRLRDAPEWLRAEHAHQVRRVSSPETAP